ncbi:MAG: MBL fold metallo-hydrolase [Syntrophobacteraceae bacterium]
MTPMSLQVQQVDRVTVWVVTDNYYDALRPDGKVARRFRLGGPGRSIHAEHGLSYYIETVVDGKTSACMFDYGQDSGGVSNNLDLLGIDPGKAKAFGLSHGHFDHWGGAIDILKRARSSMPPGTPFYVGEECFAHRFLSRPGDTVPMDLGWLKKEEIEAAGFRVVEVSEPVEMIPGAYLTGNIERVTPYERVPPVLVIERDGKLEPDDFRGEQAIFFHVKDKGLVVLSGCAHAGIVNTVRQAQKIAGTQKIHAILGGFHLINAKPEIIQKTLDDIKAMKPDVVAPTHCTGLEAIEAFEREMPEAFNLNTAGSHYTFGS